MKFPPLWLNRHKTDGYLPASNYYRSRMASTLTILEPSNDQLPRIFLSANQAVNARAKYVEGVFENTYEDGIVVSRPSGGPRKKEDYETISVQLLECLMGKPMIFVFGSNEAGIHGAGAARYALDNHGAILGKGHGHYGQSYALPTKSAGLRVLALNEIHMYVDTFIAYAKDHPEWAFKVTQIGCGLSRLSAKDVAPLFANAPDNCYFDTAWKDWLKPETKFWGTF